MSNPEDWLDRAQEALDVADAVLWSRIQQGQWTNIQEGRKVMAAHKQIETAKGNLLDALAFGRGDGMPQPQPPTPDAQPAPRGPKPLEMRPHMHVWKPNADGVNACTVPGCGLLGDDEPF